MFSYGKEAKILVIIIIIIIISCCLIRVSFVVVLNVTVDIGKIIHADQISVIY